MPRDSAVVDVEKWKLETTTLGPNLTRHPAGGRKFFFKRYDKWKRVRYLGSGTYGRVRVEECISGPSKGRCRAVKEVQRAQIRGSNWKRELEALATFSDPSQETVSH